MKFPSLALGLLLALAAHAAQKGDDAPPKPAPPEVGKAAPAFRLNDHLGRAVEVPAGIEERWTVLAFFPKAATPG